jgi:hypothetical protein
MKLAINPQWRGKMPKNMSPTDKQLWWRSFNGNFLNVDITNRDFAKAVRMGFAYTSQHVRYRKKENFAQSQFVAIDYDTEDERSSFDTLLSDELISRYASFLHTTPSHTDEHPRCRVVFELDRSITNVYKYELLVRSFLYHYGDSDPSCKDGNRLYFGAIDCDIHYVNRVMPLDVARDMLVVPYSEHVEQKRLQRVEMIANGTCDVANEIVQLEVAMLLEKVRTARNGNKHDTLLRVSRLLGGMSASGYFSQSDAITWLQTAIAMNQNEVEDVRAAYRLIETFVRFGTGEPYFI